MDSIRFLSINDSKLYLGQIIIVSLNGWYGRIFARQGVISMCYYSLIRPNYVKSPRLPKHLTKYHFRESYPGESSRTEDSSYIIHIFIRFPEDRKINKYYC